MSGIVTVTIPDSLLNILIMDRHVLLLAFCLLMQCSVLFAQRDSTGIIYPAREKLIIFNGVSIERSGATNLAELLRFQLQIEIEQSPAEGTARIRTHDLNSRYFKVLINDVPVAGSDMFGGQILLNTIMINPADSVVLSYSPASVQLGSGALAGWVNIYRSIPADSTKTGFTVIMQETMIGKEYNWGQGAAAQGKHFFSLAFRHSVSPKWTWGINVTKSRFNGKKGIYKGRGRIEEPEYQRGYEWSPVTVKNMDSYVGFRNKGTDLSYYLSVFNQITDYYGREVQQVYDDYSNPLPVFGVDDYSFSQKRILHRLRLQNSYNENLQHTTLLSYQQAGYERRIDWMNTATGKVLNSTGNKVLHKNNALHARSFINKRQQYANWEVGVESDYSRVMITAEAGNYLSEAIHKDIFKVAVYGMLEKKIAPFLSVQSGVRLEGTASSGIKPVVNLSGKYSRKNHWINVLFATVHRYPNIRESYTYLENEFSLLEGNNKLRPETGVSGILQWNYKEKENSILPGLTIETGWRLLSDRIVIAGAPPKLATQDYYRYTNLNKHISWTTRIAVSKSGESLKYSAGWALTGIKGSDYATAALYKRYLFYQEANAHLSYDFSVSAWVAINYRFVGAQPLYTFERPDITSSNLLRVHNVTSPFSLLDFNMGKTLHNEKITLSGGVHNLLNVQAIDYWASDGKEHYRGDLRTQHIGYGRGFYIKLMFTL